ncbi:unnamed protein product [Ambrosiozyma monospora]|uniref:Dihydroxyacetone kinase n=1 Tax=Ambrosiozyma monospora TaxID=43982 RepID=A0A9W7DJQ2_AMBMO|nr:unnamed protein product [Ambrosiozyma monospora]
MPITKHWKYEEEIVTSSLKGLCHANPDLKLIESERVVFNSVSPKDKVFILSGGGSGHEPLHGGFVGTGGIDIVAAGYVFASPSSKQIYTGLKTHQSSKGTLVVVKNYTGDILHFGLAAEKAKAEGYPVELVIVQDDVAIGKTKNGMVGRRGLSGTAFVHKVAGAKSAKDNNKASLKEVYQFVSKVNENLVTIGASLDHVTIPGKQEDEDDPKDSDDENKFEYLKEDEAELGLGIHNELGAVQLSPIPSVEKLVPQLLEYLLKKDDPERNYVDFAPDDEVALMVNNLGSTSYLELYAIQNTVTQQLNKLYGIKPVRTYTGTYTTSLDGPGFSITLLNITKAGGKEVLDCLDYPTTMPGWNSPFTTLDWTKSEKSTYIVEAPELDYSDAKSQVLFTPEIFKAGLYKGCKAALAKRDKITFYDTVAGDGDCGDILANGCHAVIKLLDEDKLELKDGIVALSQLTDVIETAMGGTSGGLYSIYVSSIAKALREKEKESKDGSPIAITSSTIAPVLEQALKSFYNYTRARIGDRTLVDTLAPFVTTLVSTKGDLKQASKAAHEGAEATRKFKAKFGRATYVDESELAQFDDEGGLPDPGAIGLAALIDGFVEGYFDVVKK